jgi:hypothetical protein
MAQIIRTPDTKIITKNGENILSITMEPIVIEITINVNHDGNISVGNAKTKNVEEENEPKNFVAPAFGGFGKVKFGKNIGD